MDRYEPVTGTVAILCEDLKGIAGYLQEQEDNAAKQYGQENCIKELAVMRHDIADLLQSHGINASVNPVLHDYHLQMEHMFARQKFWMIRRNAQKGALQ